MLLCIEERGALQVETHVVIHPHIVCHLRQHYGFARKVHIIQNALDPDVRRRLGTVSRPIGGRAGMTAIWVGQTDYGKGLDVALAAVRMARQEMPGLRLLVVGLPSREGPAKDGVEWLGVLSPDAVADAYRRSDVLLFPSRYESFGLVVLEAMAAGLPVIVSDAIPAGVVVDGRNGTVVSGHRPEDYAAALLSLQSDPARRSRIEEANRKDVQRFDAMATADRYANVALSVVGDVAHRRCGN
jgi:glycosyltransferase involved in cell wall biosynthesis